MAAYPIGKTFAVEFANDCPEEDPPQRARHIIGNTRLPGLIKAGMVDGRCMIRGRWPKRIINRSTDGCGQLQQILERFGAFNALQFVWHRKKAAAG
jgi:hypothetical protein